MTMLRVGEVVFDVDGVVFDKDGTLVDLDASWSAAGRAWVQTAAGGDTALAEGLEALVGLDAEAGKLVPDGLLAAGTVGEISHAVAAFLAGAGVTDAEARNEAARLGALAEAADPRHMLPIGDVAGAFTRLTQAGISLAVLTSDDRAVAAETMAVLGVAELVEVIVGGDDEHDPKPSPDGLLYIAAMLGAAPGRLVMVGDSTGDMRAGRSAGVAATVAVGRSSPAASLADVVVASIEELVPLRPAPS